MTITQLPTTSTPATAIATLARAVTLDATRRFAAAIAYPFDQRSSP